MKSKWRVELSQNGWEYTGWVTFYAESAEIKDTEDHNILLVDGYEVEFDEEVANLTKIELQGG